MDIVYAYLLDFGFKKEEITRVLLNTSLSHLIVLSYLYHMVIPIKISLK